MSSRMATVTGTITNNAGILCSLAVLGTYAGIAGHAGAQSPPLDVNRLFSIATTVNLMSTPLSILGKPYFNRMMNMALDVCDISRTIHPVTVCWLCLYLTSSDIFKAS